MSITLRMAAYPPVAGAPDLAQLVYVAAVSVAFLMLDFTFFTRGEGQYTKYVVYPPL